MHGRLLYLSCVRLPIKRVHTERQHTLPVMMQSESPSGEQQRYDAELSVGALPKGCLLRWRFQLL
jgi:hypothetical protein